MYVFCDITFVTVRQTGRHKGRQTYKQTGRQRGRWTDRQTNRRVAPEFCPGGEPSHLPIVAIHSKVEFWSDQQNLPVVENHTAVVTNVLVHHRPIKCA